jgi:hypothetical protein
MLRLINICTFLLLLGHLAQAQAPSSQKRTVLAIGLFTGPNSSMVSFAFVSLRGEQIIGSRPVRPEVFMYTAMGHWPGIVNLAKENLFEKHGVDSCFLVYDEYGKVNGWYAKPFEELWKIRFYEHPYDFERAGWSQGRIKPSLYQMKYIKHRYGVKNVLTEYFYGDTLFKLLRDIQDPSWVSIYRTADSTTQPTDTTGIGGP